MRLGRGCKHLCGLEWQKRRTRGPYSRRHDCRCRCSTMEERAQGTTTPTPYIPYHDYRPSHYESIFRDKVLSLEDFFRAELEEDQCQMSGTASPATNFRLRCRLAIGEEKGRLFYCMYDGPDKPKIEIVGLPIASREINELMPKLLEALGKRRELSEGLAAVHFLSTLAQNDIVCTLIYERELRSEAWQEDARWLRHAVQATSTTSVSFIGRSRGLKLVEGNDFVVETMKLSDGSVISLKQPEGAFSNPNGVVCLETMNHISRICKNINPTAEHDLLDLFAGSGTYTVPLSKYFRKVVSVELRGELVDVASENMKNNSVGNVSFHRKDCMKFSASMLKGEEYRAYNFSTILLDPPRAGLDPNTLRLAKNFEHIIYISCNADTLKSCLKELRKTHQLQSPLTVFDHFPYTRHSEVVAHLKMR